MIDASLQNKYRTGRGLQLDRERLLEFIDVGDIPSLPEAAKLAIDTGLSDGRSIDDVSKIVLQNPSLTAKILKVANSAYYSRNGKVSNIKDAIVLLGYKTVKSIILSITIRDIFKEKDISWFEYKKFWLHSIATAIIAREIAKSTGRKNDDELYTAGLLHDIGKSIFLISAEKDYKNSVNLARAKRIPLYEAENITFGFDHSDVASFILDQWGLPEKIVRIIRNHHTAVSPSGTSGDIQPVEDLILLASNILAKTAGYKTLDEEPPYKNTQMVLDRIGLLGSEIDRILIDLNEEIKSLLSILEIPGSYIKGIFAAIQEANSKLGDMILENKRYSVEITQKKDLIENLNELSLFLLEENNIENLLRGISLRISSVFKIEKCNIYFHLNENKTIMARSYNPGLTQNINDIDSSVDFIQRKEIRYIENGEMFRVSSNEGKEIAIINYTPPGREDQSGIRLFLEYISVSLNNVYLQFLSRLKSEKLQIAVKRLKEEIEARRRSNLLNELIIENSPIGIVITDSSGNIILYNTKSEELLDTEIKGKNILKDIPRISKFLVDYLKNPKQKENNLEIQIRKDGKIRYLFFQYKKLNETNYYLFMVQDITKRKIDEAMLTEKKSIETLGELAAGIAHNLRSPLAAAKGISELIVDDIKRGNLKIVRADGKEEYEDKEIKENLSIISKSIEKTFNIINSVLELSRGTELPDITDSRFRFKDIVNEVYSLLEHRFKEKGIQFETDIECNEIKGSKNMFTQILLNLINNSIDAVEKNGWIQVSCKKKKGNYIIEVADNGIGIPKENLEKIFEPFYSTSGEATGRGIGLSITKKMVLAHHGIIRAFQREGGGTVIQIIIPDKMENG